MHPAVPIERLVDLLDPAGNLIFNMSVDQAAGCVGSGETPQDEVALALDPARLAKTSR